MGQFINLLIVLGSLGGIVFILYRKIPLLVALPPDEKGLKESLKQGIGKLAVAQRIKSKKVFDGTLLKARYFAAKTEAQTAQWLEKLTKKSEQRKEEFHESYWDQLRKKGK